MISERDDPALTPSRPMRTPTLAPSGDLGRIAPLTVLRFCERVRFSGTLAFQSTVARGVLPMLNGVPEIPHGEHASEIQNALEAFLAHDDGRYTLMQTLPALDGSVPDGDLALLGPLERLSVADLLRHAELVGLTGRIEITNDGRNAVASFTRGELQSLTIDGRDEAALAEMFAWRAGRFTMLADPLFVGEGELARSVSDSAAHAVIELPLAEVLARSARGALTSGRRTPINGFPRPPSVLGDAAAPFGVSVRGTARVPTSRPQSETTRPRSVPPPGPSLRSPVRVEFVDPSATPAAASQPVAPALPPRPMPAVVTPLSLPPRPGAPLATPSTAAPAMPAPSFVPLVLPSLDEPASMPVPPLAATNTNTTAAASLPSVATPLPAVAQPAPVPDPSVSIPAFPAAPRVPVLSTPESTGATARLASDVSSRHDAILDRAVTFAFALILTGGAAVAIYLVAMLVRGL